MSRAPGSVPLAVLLLTITVAVSVSAAAQATASPQGWVTTGPVMTPAPASPPLLTTPSMSFVTVSPSPVGATAATGNNTAGATASTLSAASSPGGAVRTDAMFTDPTGGAAVDATAAPGGNGEAEPAAATDADAAATGGAPNGARVFNAGIGSFAGTGTVASPSGGSLGELARSVAPNRTPQAGRVYTNEDVARLEEFVQSSNGRVSAEEAGIQRGPAALAAPPLVPDEPRGAETRLDIQLQPEGVEATPQQEQEIDEPQPQPQAVLQQPDRQATLTARAQPQETPATEAPADQRAPATLPATASPLPFLAVLAGLSLGIGIISKHQRR